MARVAGSAEMTVVEKLWQLNWGLVLLLTVVAGVGFAMMVSAAGGGIEPWATRQGIRFAAGLALMLLVAVTDVRVWMRHAYVLYGVSLLLLVAVEVAGTTGMGAQRWLSLGGFRLQPSEVVKITMVLALARYFHGVRPEEVSRLRYLAPPVLIVLMPAALVLKQPDLGTAGVLSMAGFALFFMAGVSWRFFAGLGVLAMAAIPLGWQFLHDYQRRRLITFFNPENDPLGSGYHIIQSKIALGSGGVLGKGFLGGTQSHLNFLPEKQTDFVFTMLAEELGLLGGLTLLALYGLVILYGFSIALRSRNQFGRLVALGVTSTFFIYLFINIAMVMGLLPVVGVPLPLISYGGTAMLTLLFGFGLVLNTGLHGDQRIGRRGGDE